MMLSQKILVKSGSTSLKTGYKIEVSEIMDLEKMPVLYASERYNRSYVIA